MWRFFSLLPLRRNIEYYLPNVTAQRPVRKRGRRKREREQGIETGENHE